MESKRAPTICWRILRHAHVFSCCLFLRLVTVRDFAASFTEKTQTSQVCFTRLERLTGARATFVPGDLMKKAG